MDLVENLRDAVNLEAPVGIRYAAVETHGEFFQGIILNSPHVTAVQKKIINKQGRSISNYLMRTEFCEYKHTRNTDEKYVSTTDYRYNVRPSVLRIV